MHTWIALLALSLLSSTVCFAEEDTCPAPKYTDLCKTDQDGLALTNACRCFEAFPQEQVVAAATEDLTGAISGSVLVRVTVLNLGPTAAPVSVTLRDEYVGVGIVVRNRTTSDTVWHPLDATTKNGWIYASSVDPDTLPPGTKNTNGLEHATTKQTIAAGGKASFDFITRVGFKKTGLDIKNTAGTGGGCEPSEFVFYPPDPATGRCGTAPAGTTNQVCTGQINYKTRASVVVHKNTGAVLAAISVYPRLCNASASNVPVQLFPLNGGRPF